MTQWDPTRSEHHVREPGSKPVEASMIPAEVSSLLVVSCVSAGAGSIPAESGMTPAGLTMIPGRTQQHDSCGKTDPTGSQWDPGGSQECVSRVWWHNIRG